MTTAELRLQVDSHPPVYAHELGLLSKRNTLFKINALKKTRNTGIHFKIKVNPYVPFKVG